MAANIIPHEEIAKKVREAVKKKINESIQEAIEMSIEEIMTDIIVSVQVFTINALKEQEATVILNMNTGKVYGSFYADDLPDDGDELPFEFNVISLMENEIRENAVCDGNIKFWKKMFTGLLKDMKDHSYDCEEDGSCHKLKEGE